MCIFRWQTILTRVTLPSQKTIYNFKLVVGHTTKHMKHGCSCDIEIWWPSVENVALGLRPRVTFSTSGSSYLNVHSLLCIICIMSTYSSKWLKHEKSKDTILTFKNISMTNIKDQPTLNKVSLKMHNYETQFSNRLNYNCISNCNWIYIGKTKGTVINRHKSLIPHDVHSSGQSSVQTLKLCVHFCK